MLGLNKALDQAFNALSTVSPASASPRVSQIVRGITASLILAGTVLACDSPPEPNDSRDRVAAANKQAHWPARDFNSAFTFAVDNNSDFKITAIDPEKILQILNSIAKARNDFARPTKITIQESVGGNQHYIQAFTIHDQLKDGTTRQIGQITTEPDKTHQAGSSDVVKFQVYATDGSNATIHETTAIFNDHAVEVQKAMWRFEGGTQYFIGEYATPQDSDSTKPVKISVPASRGTKKHVCSEIDPGDYPGLYDVDCELK